MHRKYLLITMTMFPLLINGNSTLVADDKNSQEITKNIQGKWSSLWTNASSCKIGDKLVFEFKGNKVQVSDERTDASDKENDTSNGAQFQLIPSAEPGEGSINMIDSSTQTVGKGIYKLKRDTLILYLAGSGKPRPESIDIHSEENKESWLLVLVREKSKK